MRIWVIGRRESARMLALIGVILAVLFLGGNFFRGVQATAASKRQLPIYSVEREGKTISLDTANPQLEAVSTYLGASAWVLDHKGAVVAETSPASHSGKTIEGFDPTVTGNKSYIIGDFFGMFPGETLSVLAPITGNFNTYGYVVLHMPMERILDSQNQILNIVYITAAIIFFLSLIILLVFTRTVYFPLKKITAGAMEYAGGNLDHTIKVKTNDEMGYLADTLNYMSSELGKMEEYQKSTGEYFQK